MKRAIAYLSFLFVSIGVVAWARLGSTPQEAMSLPFVRRQASTPGSQEMGHINVNGTIIGGQHVGGGAGLTGVNADLLDGINSTAFLQSIPVPLLVIGSNSNYILGGENLSTVAGSSGVAGKSLSTQGRGVFGLGNASAGVNSGVYGQSNSTSGNGVYGVAIAGTGINYGGRFESASTSGTAVLGWSTAGSGDTIGVYGQSGSTTGRGVYGLATAPTGGTYGGWFESGSPSGVGVLGWATATSGSIYGVYGVASTASTGYGVFASGDSGASGTKAFRIDHPFDPTGKYLLHYASESPMPQNFYVGNVVTDAKGYAWVELPDYFQEINTNFKYQLTVISGGEDFVQAMVSKEIQGTRFQVRTSAPNVKVSWRVDADRNDLYVRHKKPKDVVEKQDLERGKYQHPELYGEPEERGMNYRHNEKATRPPAKQPSRR